MKILVLNWQDRLNPYAGGAETHLHEIFSRIAAAGHEITLFCSAFEGAKHEEILDGMRVIREGSRNTFNFFVPRRYKQDFARQGFDIVIDDINKIPFFTPLYVKEPLLALTHHLFGRSIFVEAGIISGLYVYSAEALLPKVYHSTPLVAVSDSTKLELAQKGFNPAQISVIPNCINREQFPFSAQPQTAAKPLLITYFGRLKRYKSVQHLLEAFSLIQEEFPRARLRIMGKGDYEPELRNIASHLGLMNASAPKIEFLGYVAESDKAILLGESHIMVNPSMKEGWGIINIEANACGVPVIAADVPGLRDAVRHRESGLLYEYGNINALADALRAVLRDNILHQHLQRGAIEFAQKFDWAISAKEMLVEIEQVVGKYLA